MKRKTVTAVPVTISVLMHVTLFASLVVVLDFDRAPDLAIPLALNATLVTENAVVIPPQVEEPPAVEKPPPPQPDTQEQERLAAEQQKREEEARAEEVRLQKIEREKEEAEKQRLAEAEAERKRKEAEAEAEEERRRVEAEEERQADIERQRLENERLRKEAEDVARAEALDEEAEVLQSQAASAKAAYIFKIQQKVTRNWVQPITAEKGLDCSVRVTQTPGGVVTKVDFGRCNGDATVRRSIEAAVQKASPLPAPRDPSVFDREVTLNFKT